MSAVTFGPLEMVLASLLVLGNAGFSLIFSLGIHRSILMAAFRMAVQLLLAGFVLGFVFRQGSSWLSLCIVSLMLVAASYEVGARQRSRLAGFRHYGLSGIAVSGATGLVCAFALLTLADTPDWSAPRTVIPVFGIILGSAMSAGSVALNSMLEGVRSGAAAIEAQLALGRTPRRAMAPVMRRAVHAGTLPILNQMAGAGIITLPGIMSGQILAGADPITAAQSQIFLMLLLCAAAVGCVVVSVWLAARSLIDNRERLRLERIHAR